MLTAPVDIDLFAIARSLVLLAVVAFLAGFGGYLLFGPPNVASLNDRQAPVAAAASPIEAAAPASDDWNLPRKI